VEFTSILRYAAAMSARLPQPAHEADTTTPAPGDLELVRSFLSLHDHAAGTSASLPPVAESLDWWFHDQGLLAPEEHPTEEELHWALAVRDALRTMVAESMGADRDAGAIDLLNAAARETGLEVCFGCTDDARFHPRESGIRRAIGRLLGIAFLAELDDSWHRLRECGDANCLAVFYDGSKNRSARWCSMQTCGNRNKVRRFRERRTSGSVNG